MWDSILIFQELSRKFSHCKITELQNEWTQFFPLATLLINKQQWISLSLSRLKKLLVRETNQNNRFLRSSVQNQRLMIKYCFKDYFGQKEMLLKYEMLGLKCNIINKIYIVEEKKNNQPLLNTRAKPVNCKTESNKHDDKFWISHCDVIKSPATDRDMTFCK